MRHTFDIAGTSHTLWVTKGHDEFALLTETGSLPVRLSPLGGTRYALHVGGRREIVHLVREGDDVHLHWRGAGHVVRFLDPVRLHAGGGETAGADVARAPMPGTVIAVAVAEGQAVLAGDPLVIIESMKLETTIRAARDGVVATVHVSVGGTFEKDAVLLTLAPGDA